MFARAVRENYRNEDALALLNTLLGRHYRDF